MEDEYVQRSERRRVNIFFEVHLLCVSYYLLPLLDGEFMTPETDLLGLRSYFKCLVQSCTKYSVYENFLTDLIKAKRPCTDNTLGSRIAVMILFKRFSQKIRFTPVC